MSYRLIYTCLARIWSLISFLVLPTYGLYNLNVIPYRYTYSAHHTFKADDTYSKIVHCHTMILSTHDFRGHVTRCTTCLFGIIRIPNTSYSEIGNSQITFFIKHQILWLDVSMQNTLIMHVFKRIDYARYEKAGLFFWKATMSGDVITKITST